MQYGYKRNTFDTGSSAAWRTATYVKKEVLRARHSASLSYEKNSLLRLGAVALTLLLTAGLLSQAVFAQTTYVITDGDRVLVHTTYATDPAAVLTEAGLELGEEDTFTTQSDGNVSEITVNRIQMVRVNHDGQALEVATYGSTVSGILEQLGISTEGDLRISQSLDSATYDGMVIDVVALTYETVEYVRSEPYQTIYCTDSTLAPGEEQVLTPGPGGQRSLHRPDHPGKRDRGLPDCHPGAGSLRPGKRRSGPGHRPLQ